MSNSRGSQALARKLCIENDVVYACGRCGAHRPMGYRCCGAYAGMNGEEPVQRRNVHDNADADDEEVGDFLQASIARLDRERSNPPTTPPSRPPRGNEPPAPEPAMGRNVHDVQDADGGETAARESQVNLGPLPRSVMNEATVRATEAGKKTISASMMRSVLRSATGRLSGGEGSPPARPLETAFSQVSIEDSVLKAIDAASEAASGTGTDEEKLRESWKALPLFDPGRTYSAADAKNGFRVLDGYEVSMSNTGRVRIGKTRSEQHEKRTVTLFPSLGGDGLDWVYWDDFFKNAKGMSLQECIVAYGIGGSVNPELDARAKVVFLDEDKSTAKDKCFILAMDRPKTGGQRRVRCQEDRRTTRRIHRATHAAEAKQLDALWTAVQYRQGRRVMHSFWHMPDTAQPTDSRDGGRS